MLIYYNSFVSPGFLGLKKMEVTKKKNTEKPHFGEIMETKADSRGFAELVERWN